MILNNFTVNLQMNDLENFIHEQCVEMQLAQVPSASGKSSYVRFQGHWYGPNPEFTFDDFNFVGMNSYSSYDLSKEWRKFMFKKFGEDYKKALEEFANEQRNAVMNSIL